MTERRKLAAILAADVAGYGKLAGTDEERTLARLRALRSDLFDPTIALHHGRVVKRTGDGVLVEFRSVVDAVRCAIEVQNGMVERNAGLTPERRIDFRIGVHLGDVVEESDGDLMGDGVNIASRLEGIAQAGAICLSEDAYRQVKSRLDLAVTDLGATQLKNIAEPVRVYSLEIGTPAKLIKQKHKLLVPGLVACLALIVVVAFGATWYFASVSKSPSPSVPQATAPLSATAELTKPAKARDPTARRLSIVVLPFINLSKDAGEDYFADGITENLTTDLSRLRGSFVIARSTAFTFKGRSVDAREIGRELGVRYVLESSVQRDPDRRLRVNVQLIDAENGNHLWAERFDKPLADLFDMQDEIVARLANTLGTQLIAFEANRAFRTASPDSMDLYFQGMGFFFKGAARENLMQARGHFERALVLDGGNVDAEFGIAAVDTLLAAYYMTNNRSEYLAQAETHFAKLLLLEPNSALLHYWMGLVKTQVNQAAQGVAELDRALALDPNLATAHSPIFLTALIWDSMR